MWSDMAVMSYLPITDCIWMEQYYIYFYRQSQVRGTTPPPPRGVIILALAGCFVDCDITNHKKVTSNQVEMSTQSAKVTATSTLHTSLPVSLCAWVCVCVFERSCLFCFLTLRVIFKNQCSSFNTFLTDCLKPKPSPPRVSASL